jgi:hypothetical protein
MVYLSVVLPFSRVDRSLDAPADFRDEGCQECREHWQPVVASDYLAARASSKAMA